MFKYGDKVICLETTNGWFTKGNVYEVCECPENWYNTYNQHVFIKENDQGEIDGWDIKYFKKVDLDIFNELGD